MKLIKIVKNISLISISTILGLTLFSCGSTNGVVEQVPLWANEMTLESIYPKSQYIARIGSSANAQAAATMAESEIITYFNHTVMSKTRAFESRTMKDDKYSTTQNLEREVNIRSSIELFAVRKTNPWYDKQTGTYISCAYIDRNEAWTLYRPHILRDSQTFRSFYDSAAKESDAFKKIKILHNAEESAQIFADDLEFARILSPSGITEFAADSKKLAGMKEAMASARLAASMKITVKNDDGNRISRLVTSLLSGEGYYLSDREFAYLVNVNVEKNIKKHKDGDDTILTSEPGLSITITNGSEKLFSYNKSFNRISGFNETFVDKKLYSALEDEINESFVKEFKAALE